MTSRYACCAFSFRNLLHSPFRQGQVIRGRFLRFLDEPVQYDEHLVVKATDEPGYPLARKRRAHFPKTIFEASHQWPPNRPAELHSHEVEPDSAPVGLVEAAQPNRAPGTRPLPCGKTGPAPPGSG